MKVKNTTPKKRLSAAVKLGGRQLVFGLTWQINDQAQMTYRQIRRQAIKAGHDLFLYRKTDNRSQYALASVATGAKRGYLSAATVAATWTPPPINDENPVASWCGIFSVGDGYWVVGINRALVVPSGDRWFNDLDDALLALEDLRRDTSFHRVFVDDKIPFPVEDSAVFHLPDILKGKGVALQSTKDILYLAAAGACATIGLAGFLIYSDYTQRIEFEQQAQKLRMESEQRAASDAARRAAILPPPDPWLMTPHPMSVATDCARTMSPLTVAPAGWQVTNLSCTAGAVVGVSWRRLASGLPRTLVEGAKHLGIERVSYASESGNEASASLPVASPNRPFAASAPTLSFLNANLALREATRQITGRVTTREDRGTPLPAIPENQTHSKDAIEKSRPYITFTLSTPLPPQAWSPIIFLPGLVIKELQYSVSTGNNSVGSTIWTATGIMYVVR